MNQQTEIAPSRHLPTRDLMLRLWREHIGKHAGLLWLALIFMALTAAATGFTAWLMEPIVNDVFLSAEEGALWLVSGAIFAAFVVKGIANFTQNMLIAGVGLRIIADCQNRLYGHLLRMDLAFFHGSATGMLISRFTIDINQMRQAVSNVFVGLGKDLLTVVALIVVMFIEDWRLALISFFVFPLTVLPIVRLGRRMRRVTANTQHEMGEFTTTLEQTFQGIRVVRAYLMEGYEKSRVARVVETIRRLNLRAARTRAIFSPVMESLGGIAVAIVVIYGGYQVMSDPSRAGEIFAFITALLLAYEPMKRLANLNASLQEGLAGAQRMFALLDVSPNVTESPSAQDIEVSEGHIELDHVRFGYGADRAALSDVSIEVPAGKTVALVGPSGAGKSTVLNLIPRFYDVEAGRVTIDGVDVRDATFASLHGAIALVSQEITLFDDTIRSNIAYGRAGATEEEIEQAARDAGAHDFIAALPDGYETQVGEHGVKLSGGQRQRLAIARAMLKDAPILLLDEATSALDTETERQVQAALARLKQGRTTVVIAHRLSTVADADIIYVMDEGSVVESGSHSELMARKGAYARLYALQFADRDTPVAPARAHA